MPSRRGASHSKPVAGGRGHGQCYRHCKCPPPGCCEKPAFVLVAEVDGDLIGSVIGTFDGWRGNIYRLVVHPSYQRQGIARALVVEVEKQLAHQGVKRITALVEKNHPWATGFWDAVEYERDTRMVRYVRNLPTSL